MCDSDVQVRHRHDDLPILTTLPHQLRLRSRTCLAIAKPEDTPLLSARHLRRAFNHPCSHPECTAPAHQRSTLADDTRNLSRGRTMRQGVKSEHRKKAERALNSRTSSSSSTRFTFSTARTSRTHFIPIISRPPADGSPSAYMRFSVAHSTPSRTMDLVLRVTPSAHIAAVTSEHYLCLLEAGCISGVRRDPARLEEGIRIAAHGQILVGGYVLTTRG